MKSSASGLGVSDEFILNLALKTVNLENAFGITLTPCARFLECVGIPISRTPIFSNLPITETKSRSHPFQPLKFYPRFLKLSDFSNQFSFSLKARKIGISLYCRQYSHNSLAMNWFLGGEKIVKKYNFIAVQNFQISIYPKPAFRYTRFQTAKRVNLAT